MESPDGGIDPETQRAGSDTEGGSDLRLASGVFNALTDVPGVEVGHYTYDRVQRGVTAILCKAGATAGVSVRGANPGTFNTDALAPNDPPDKFARLAEILVDNLAAPDLVVLEEVQDNSGTANDGVVAADQTAATLITAITAAGGPVYQYRDITPVDGQDGGQPSGNIRVGFLFRTDRGRAFVDRPGGDATTAVQVLPGPQLSLSPGRISIPTNPAFAKSQPEFSQSRKPLVGEFTYQGHPLFVVRVHFNSKGGDDPLFGRRSPRQRNRGTTTRPGAGGARLVDALLVDDPEAQSDRAGRCQ